MGVNQQKNQIFRSYFAKAIRRAVNIVNDFLPDAILSALALTENDRYLIAEQAVEDGLIEDLIAYAKNDPAAKEDYEYVYDSCKGFEALLYYRIAHTLIFSEITRTIDKQNVRLINKIARSMTEEAKVRTGIDINPRCKIGKGCVIDHGVGTQIGYYNGYSQNTDVVGETAEIGEYCIILNDVVIGAHEVNKGQKQGRRQPIIGNHVTICSGARLLGPINIGDNVLIGTRAIICKDIPSDSQVTLISQYQIVKTEQEDLDIRIDGLIEGDMEQTVILAGSGLQNVTLTIMDMIKLTVICEPIHIISNNGKRVVFEIPKLYCNFVDQLALRVTKADNIELYVYSDILKRSLKRKEL